MSGTRVVAPLLAAVAAATTVLLIGMLSGSRGSPGPAPPDPIVADRVVLSLDRCAAALQVAGMSDRYPDRADWRPLAGLSRGGFVVTMLDAEVPFVCATGPTTVDVSEPLVAVPVGTARLLLSAPSGVLAAVAPAGQRVDMAAGHDHPLGSAAARYFLGVTAEPVTDVDELAVAIDDGRGSRVHVAPSRMALPGLRVVDRRTVPPDRSTQAAAMLRSCLAAQATRDSRTWVPAQVIEQARGAVLIAVSRGVVGGCAVTADGATPLRVWRIGVESEALRPFVWLPVPGGRLPDLDRDIAVGPASQRIARMEITAGAGQSWPAAVGGGTFAVRIPAGVAPDPRKLGVRAFDVDNRLIYEGPAAG